mmetsp:Transcript_85588/g.173667  ORF Transcript_85588/g.173667 Transcript_85588/m.173667 type:complete len:328 (-) Transcript_85588:107-1090(-)
MQNGVPSSGAILCNTRVAQKLNSSMLLLCAVVCGLHTQYLAEALGNESIMSRIKTAQCALQVSVGRIPGTAMPEEWAASGAKLGFLLEVEFCEESCANYEMTKERLLLGTASSSKGLRLPPASLKAVKPLNDPTFISASGQQEIKVTEGAYGCELQNIQSQQYGFRFFLDFPEGAVRNDVELPAERIYFISSCWIRNAASFERSQNRYNELEESLQEIQREIINIQIESESNNIFGKAMGLRQTAVLVDKKKLIEAQLYELEQAYPLEKTTQQDLLEGPKDLLFVKDGVIAVKRFRGTMDTREQYHWVGTFSFQEFFEDLDESVVCE